MSKMHYVTDIGDLKRLIRNEYDINKRNEYEETPLMRAICSGQPLELIEAFLKHGANPNGANMGGTTPLYFAVTKRRNRRLIKMLLEYGADIRCDNIESDPKLDHIFLHLRDLAELLMKYKFLRKARNVERIRRFPNGRHFYLEYKEIVDLNLTPDVYNLYKDFLDSCSIEVVRMNTVKLCGECTLVDFVSSRNMLECLPEEAIVRLIARLCIELYSYHYHVYNKMIVSRIGRVRLLKIINEKSLLATFSMSANRLERKHIVLNPDVVSCISKYLRDEDLLKFVVALYNL